MKWSSSIFFEFMRFYFILSITRKMKSPIMVSIRNTKKGATPFSTPFRFSSTYWGGLRIISLTSNISGRNGVDIAKSASLSITTICYDVIVASLSAKWAELNPFCFGLRVLFANLAWRFCASILDYAAIIDFFSAI